MSIQNYKKLKRDELLTLCEQHKLDEGVKAFTKQKKEDYFFGTCCENRIEMSEGRDIALNPEQKGKDLNYFIYPYVEIDGRAFENVKRNFSFNERR